jgi:hypothetical protein
VLRRRDLRRCTTPRAVAIGPIDVLPGRLDVIDRVPLPELAVGLYAA